jgi:hypothetical protein
VSWYTLDLGNTTLYIPFCWTCDYSGAYVWCIVILLFPKCVEWMIALRRQLAVRVFRESCRRSPWAATWWRQVSSDLLCPIYFIIHSLAYHDQPKDLLVFYLSCPWITFLGRAIMINTMLVLYFNQWTWWGLLYDTMIYIGYDDEHVTLKGDRAISRAPLCKDLFVEKPSGITVQPWGWKWGALS